MLLSRCTRPRPALLRLAVVRLRAAVIRCAVTAVVVGAGAGRELRQQPDETSNAPVPCLPQHLGPADLLTFPALAVCSFDRYHRTARPGDQVIML